MKRYVTVVFVLFLIFDLAACNNSAPSMWQEQYDLGMRYLSDGNYEEAIIAFRAAIDIDQKQVDAWLGLADAYIQGGDTEKALEVLQEAFDATGNSSVMDKIEEIKAQLLRAEEERRSKAMELLAECPYIGDREQWMLSTEQAEAFIDVIQNAQQRCDAMESWQDAADRKVYATMADVNGNTLLWVCGIAIWEYEAEIPIDIAFGDGCFNIMFEEIWEWDGTQAVEFSLVSDYRAHVRLRPTGLEAYVYYAGLDLDGEAWDALYPFVNGRISTSPEWCRAWAWVYDYKFDDYNIQAEEMSNHSAAQALFNGFVDNGIWPYLPFDWDTLSIYNNFWDDDGAYYAEVKSGTGYEEFYDDERSGWNGRDWPWPGYLSGKMLSSGNIAAQDGRWVEAETVINCLTKFASVE